MNPNAGAVLIAIGVFFILILNVQWDQIPELVRAYSILGAGLVCLAAFATVQGTKGEGVMIGAEVAHQVAGAVAAAIILGSIFTSLGGFPFWDLFEDERGDEASRALEIEGQVFTGEAAMLSLNATSLELELKTWDNQEIGVNGTITVFGGTPEKAQEYLNQTTVRLSRGSREGMPSFTVEVDAPEAGRPLGFRGYKLFVTLRVPAGVKLDLDLVCVSGGYSISNVQVGEASLRTISGDVRLDDVTGEKLTISTVSGDVDGSITFDSSEIRAISGEIHLAVGLATGTYVARSTSGDIDFIVPEDDQVGFSMEGDTMSGVVDFDAEDLLYSVSKRTRKVAETTDFSAKTIQIMVEGSTTSGDVRVRS